MVGLRLAEALRGLGHRVVVAQVHASKNMEIPEGVEHEVWRIPRKALKACPGRRVPEVDAHFSRLEARGGRFDLVILSWADSHLLVEHFPADRTWLWQHAPVRQRPRFSGLTPLSLGWWRQLSRLRTFLVRLPRRRALYAGRSVVAVSAGVLETMESGHEVAFRRKKMIHNPLDMEKFNRASQGPVPEASPAVAWVGRFVPNKQPQHAIRAFAESGMDGFLWMVGNGPLLEEAKLLAKTLGVSQRVRFPGFVSDVPRWIAHSRGLLMTSCGSEGLPTVLCEAIAVGKPCVSYDCACGPSEILRGPLARGLVPLNDIPAMAKALRRMAEDPVLPSREDRSRFDAGRIAAEFLGLCAARAR